MLLGTKQQLSKVNLDRLTVGSIDVAPVTCHLWQEFRDMVRFYRRIHYLKKISITDVKTVIARVPTAFLVAPNFPSCCYISIETPYVFSIS